MHLISLELENYRQFKKAEVQFGDGIIGIVGLNGAGKSTLVEAIAWALYGNDAARTAKENIKRDSAAEDEDVSVVLTWEMHGQSYQVSRKLRGARLSPDVQFLINNEVQAHSTRAVQAVIEKTLGLDWQSFYTSFFARQKELNALSDLKAAARKDLILRMLRIDAVDRALKNVKEELKLIKTTREVLARHSEQLDSLQEALTKAKSEQNVLKQKVTREEQRCKELSEKVLEIKTTYEAERNKEKAYQKIMQKKQELESQAEQCKKMLRSVSTDLEKMSFDSETVSVLQAEEKRVEKEIAAQRNAIEKIVKNIEAHTVRRDLFRAQYKELENKEKNIQALGPKAVCPTCQRPLSGDFESITKHFIHEKSVLAKEGQELSLYIKNAEKENAEARDKLAEREKELTLIQKSLQEKLAQKNKKDYLEKQKEHFEKEIKRLEPDAAVCLNHLKTIAFNEAVFAEIEKEYSATTEHYHAAKDILQKCIMNEKLNEKDVVQLSEKVEQAQKHSSDLAAAIKEQEVLQKLIEIFGEFRVHLISKIRPTLSKIAGDLFVQITQGKYLGLMLDEEYEIFIEDQGKLYPLERFSGGEADLAHICLRLAISQYVTEQHGAEMSFIVLDEIFGSQDVLRKQALLEAMVELNKRFRQIFLITHVEEVKDIIGYTMRIYEDEEGISYVER